MHRDPSLDKNNIQIAIKLADFEAKENLAHAYNMSDMSVMSAFFLRIGFKSLIKGDKGDKGDNISTYR
ncbi:MAG: hypothetical protein QXL09_02880 [Candidatus Aenigmatarchaeota archaeon]